MKTLIAIDGSDEATTALRTASCLLRKSRNAIEVLCVGPELEQLVGQRARGVRSRAREEYRRRIATETKSILGEAEKILRAEGVEANSLSEIGSPADVIVKLAGDYDVTVIGAAGGRHGSRAGLGSVASRVVEYSAGSVLVARSLTSAETLRVLVGVDGSLASRHALSAMTAYFNIDSAEITLIHVKETPWIHLGLDREWFDYPGEVLDQADPELQLEGELQREGEEVLEAAREKLAKYNYTVSTQIQEGNPATEILGEAESGGYDLIVLGAGGATDTKHNMLGSVSAKIAWQAPCSVAVVKIPA
ncbi:MAG TPA: universal stress protein [Blastocatellia bacterium]|nr:universal stress protein [Blastocatellia bacterium]